MKKREQSLNDLCDISSGTIYASQESNKEKKKRKKTWKLFEEIMTKVFPNLRKYMNPQIQQA